MQIVIVGAGLAGLRTAEELRRIGFEGQIILVGDEPHLPYDRPPLSKEFIRGEKTDTTLRPAEFFEENNIELKLGVAVVALDASAHTLQLADGSTIGYDKLVVATGVRPRRILNFEGLAGVHALRSKNDAVKLHVESKNARRAVVIGAGFIGCEVAASFRNLGIDVVLVEPQPTPLASVLGETVGSLISRLHRSEGVDLRTGIGVTELVGDDHVTAVVLSDGTSVEADLVVIGIGSLPAVEWLTSSTVEVGNGVLADEVGRTSEPDIFTIGDVSAWRVDGGPNRVEHWSNVGDQVRTMVPAMLEIDAKPVLPPVAYFWSDQYKIKIQALGTPSARDVVHLIEDDGRKFLVYYERDGKLSAVVGGGKAGAVLRSRAAVAEGRPIADMLA